MFEWITARRREPGHAGFTQVQGIYCKNSYCWLTKPSVGYTPEHAIHQKIQQSTYFLK